MKIRIKISFKIKISILFAFFFFIFTPSSVGISSTITVPGDYATIQEAVESSSGGDIILVNDGYYVEKLLYFNKPIIIKSVNGPEFTIIEADLAFSIVSGCITIDGFTLKIPGRYINYPEKEVITTDTVNIVISNHRIVSNSVGAVISGSSSNQITGNEFSNIGATLFNASQHKKITDNKFIHGEKVFGYVNQVVGQSTICANSQ